MPTQALNIFTKIKNGENEDHFIINETSETIEKLFSIIENNLNNIKTSVVTKERNKRGHLIDLQEIWKVNEDGKMMECLKFWEYKNKDNITEIIHFTLYVKV